ncbi:hypothetical protein OHA84_35585 [Streptomyces sp. NBC_00513]|uniref:hypothetical protein n=1 Tax=unclassified Streptomyces TaxID=2593676 RepID=UPI0022598069|nr:hypothetical protein [Streptomyces sp. NBC_00424]MCX5071167.1 hypothetical protein [Streptomyces sp. NBC_00424]WUD45417.1 hypothetical protein OHA84_35585 [Streptomyces sp. NBC_00513]
MVRDSAASTDQVRLRAVLGDRGPFASHDHDGQADHAMRYRRLASLPVVDGQGSEPGVLALAR